MFLPPLLIPKWALSNGFFAFTTGYMFHNNMFWMKANHVKKQFYLLVQQAGIF